MDITNRDEQDPEEIEELEQTDDEIDDDLSTENEDKQSTVTIETDDEAKRDSASEFIAGLKKHVGNIATEYFVSPMLDTIGSLSLIDVASLARSLVGMQAMRSAASPEPASVGGFIESLVIDRANGIRWIHRLPQITTD